MWNYACHISKLFNSTLLLDSKWFVEESFLEFPNTKFVDESYFIGKPVHKVKLKTLEQEIINVIDNNTQSLFNHSSLVIVECDEGLGDNSALVSHEAPRDYVYDKFSKFIDQKSNWYRLNCEKIKFKDQKVNNFFKENFSNMVGLHLRRGPGCDWNNESYIKELSQHVKFEDIEFYYKNVYKIGPKGKYKIFPDDLYFKQIEKIIEDDSNKKIYLSHDVPKNFIQHFIDRYPNNIVTKHDYLDKFLDYFSDFDLEYKGVNSFYLKQFLINLLDLFALSYTDTFIFQIKIRKVI